MLMNRSKKLILGFMNWRSRLALYIVYPNMSRWFFFKSIELLQVERLRTEMKLKNNLREALETRTKDFEKKVADLNQKLHDVSFFNTSRST